MSNKRYDYLIRTSSREDRKDLIDYITNKEGIIISNIDDFEGPQLVRVRKDEFTFLSIAILEDLIHVISFRLFNNVQDYINYCEGK